MKGRIDLFENCDYLPFSLQCGLTERISSGNLHHFLLLASRSEKRRKEVMRSIALSWVLSEKKDERSLFHHPDIFIVHLQGKSGVYTVEAIRSVIEEIHLQPFQNGRRVIIIEHSERLSLPAANALLLALEEPPKGTLFLMTTVESQKIISTILSRALVLRIPASFQETRQEERLKEITSSLFSSPLYKPEYREIVEASEQIASIYEKKCHEKKEFFPSHIHKDEEDIEPLLIMEKGAIGESFILEIHEAWKKVLCIRGGEFRGKDGSSRFADDSLVYFHDALEENVLSLNFQEIILKLLLLLFGYSRRKEKNGLSFEL